MNKLLKISMFVLVVILILGFAGCDSKDDDNTEPNTSNPNPTGNTFIEFKNLEEFPVTIYSDSSRQTVCAEITANGTKKVSAVPAPLGIALYPTFQLTYPIGTSTITIPYNGEAVIASILENQTNTVPIPKLKSIVINSSYIMLINNSSFSLTLRKGSSEIVPIEGGSSVINSNKYASFEVTPGSVSAYSVYQNTTTPIAYPADLSEFKAGMAYVLTYNGTVLTLTGLLPINTEITVPGNNLAMKLAWLQSNILSNRSYFIDITADENIAPQRLSYSKSGITIILNGGGTMCTINLSSNGSLFTIGSGVTLILDKNITLKGRIENTSLVYIDGGTLVMNEGTIITGNTDYSSSGYYTSYGGGIYMNSGSFTMNGGEISNNTASAYYPSSSYYGNTPYSYGGGIYVSGGTFTMNGGKISENTASSSAYYYSSYGGYSYGGGVYVKGTFIMNGGEISGNTTSAYYSCYGGGVYIGVNGTFTMSGGVIYGGANNSIGLSNSAGEGSSLYKYSTATAQYGTFSGDTFYSSGILNSTDTTIRIVNGNLLTE